MYSKNVKNQHSEKKSLDPKKIGFLHPLTGMLPFFDF